jgi:hypothetical protein
LTGNNQSRQQLKQAKQNQQLELRRLQERKNYDPFLSKRYEEAGSQFTSVILSR